MSQLTGPKMEEPQNQLVHWDITSFDTTVGVEAVTKFLNNYCNTWCFQLERTKEGQPHYQMRIRLKNKLRKKKATELIHQILPTAHLSPTSSFNMNNCFYVMKEDSKIDGPWKDTDPKFNEGGLYIQKKLRTEPKWYPWQEKVIEMIEKEPDDRTVHVIIKRGNVGGSTLAKYLHMHGKARRIPCMDNMKELMQCVLGAPAAPAYFVDLPKGIDAYKLRGFFTGIEEIKNGYAYDPRHKWKENYYEPAHVFVFTNSMPDTSTLVIDRWKLWEINHKLELVPWTEKIVRLNIIQPPVQKVTDQQGTVIGFQAGPIPTPTTSLKLDQYRQYQQYQQETIPLITVGTVTVPVIPTGTIRSPNRSVATGQ